MQHDTQTRQQIEMVVEMLKEVVTSTLERSLQTLGNGATTSSPKSQNFHIVHDTRGHSYIS